MARKIGDVAIVKATDEEVTILEVHKGRKTNQPVMQSGILCVGYKSEPCSYTLSNGTKRRGHLLKFL